MALDDIILSEINWKRQIQKKFSHVDAKKGQLIGNRRVVTRAVGWRKWRNMYYEE